jgi:isoquinoline 1-oxidoreductase alpha subunit
MAAAALLKRNPNPSDEEMYTGMQGVICRCGTYPRIKNAIVKAAQLIKES